MLQELVVFLATTRAARRLDQISGMQQVLHITPSSTEVLGVCPVT